MMINAAIEHRHRIKHYDVIFHRLKKQKKNGGSDMSAHVLLNLLNELGKRFKMRGLPSIYLFFATSLINSIIHEHEC